MKTAALICALGGVSVLALVDLREAPRPSMVETYPADEVAGGLHGCVTSPLGDSLRAQGYDAELMCRCGAWWLTDTLAGAYATGISELTVARRSGAFVAGVRVCQYTGGRVPRRALPSVWSLPL